MTLYQGKALRHQEPRGPTIDEAMDLMVGEMAERLVPQRNPPEHEPPFACLDGECGLCLACRQPPPPPRPLKRPSEEILHEMERLAYDTRYASMDRATGEYREIDPAVLMFAAETMRRLAMELGHG
jgi:hypothetical protein